MSAKKGSEAGYTVQERAWSAFKRPHKTVTALPLFTLTPQSTRNMRYEGSESLCPLFLSCVVITMPLCHICLWCSLKSFKHYLLQTSLFFLLSSFSSSLGLRFIWILFFPFYPHQNLGQRSLELSRITHGEHLCVHKCCQCILLFDNAVWYVHGFFE